MTNTKGARIGFVGTGTIAKWHLKNLATVPEVSVVALCDIQRERAEAFAEPLGAAVYTDGKQLIEDCPIDGLYVCVPPHAHGDLEIQAAERGIHMMIEKPVNLYYDKARAICDAIKKAGVMSQAGYRRRYEPGSRQLKEFLADKSVGAASVVRWSGMPGMPWWGAYDKSGGQLVEQATHQVDLLRWAMGEVKAVAASYSVDRLLKERADMDAPDSQSALLIFESGAAATISVSCAAGKGAGRMQVEFILDGARIEYAYDKLTLTPEDAYVLPEPPEKGNIDHAFAQALLSGDSSLLLSPYEDALKSLAVTLAANRSAKEGGRLVHVNEIEEG